MGKVKKGQSTENVVMFYGVRADSVATMSDEDVLLLAPVDQPEVLAAFGLPYAEVTGRPDAEVYAKVIEWRRGLAVAGLKAGVSFTGGGYLQEAQDPGTSTDQEADVHDTTGGTVGDMPPVPATSGIDTVQDPDAQDEVQAPSSPSESVVQSAGDSGTSTSGGDPVDLPQIIPAPPIVSAPSGNAGYSDAPPAPPVVPAPPQPVEQADGSGYSFHDKK